MRDQRLLLSPPPAEAAASVSVLVDQLELAAADGGAAGLGGGAACAGAGVGAGAGAAVSDEESLNDPNQRVRRLPPLLLLAGCDSSATEVLQLPGEALAVRVGGGSAGGGVSPPLVLKLVTGSVRGRLVLEAPASPGVTSVVKAAIAAAPAGAPPPSAMRASTSPLPPSLRAAANSASASLLNPAAR
jgi:hypothetical protein